MTIKSVSIPFSASRSDEPSQTDSPIEENQWVRCPSHMREAALKVGPEVFERYSGDPSAGRIRYWTWFLWNWHPSATWKMALQDAVNKPLASIPPLAQTILIHAWVALAQEALSDPEAKKALLMEAVMAKEAREG